MLKKNLLKTYLNPTLIEAGCDEAGRGCLAGPVFAAAVILPGNMENNELKDSKELSEMERLKLRDFIEKNALGWAVAYVESKEIDEINILQASFRAMHRAVEKLSIRPEFLLIDGNRFVPYQDIPFECIVKGDGKYMSIAAASILAKTYRDEYMEKLNAVYPLYNWRNNKGYPTKSHREAIVTYGVTDQHRKSFRLYPLPEQRALFLK